jgi:hypothetical protein
MWRCLTLKGDSAGHLNYPTPETFRAMAAKAGFAAGFRLPTSDIYGLYLPSPPYEEPDALC